MARQTKADKALADAMALFQGLAAETGIELGDITPVDTYIKAEEKEDTLREADAVLKSLTYPTALTSKKCKACGEVFMTNYMGVGCCSTACRRAWFKKSVGLDWDFSRAPVWGEYEPPLVISAAAVAKLEIWATKFLADIEKIRTATQENQTKPNLLHSPLGWEDVEQELSGPEFSSGGTLQVGSLRQERESPTNLLEMLDTPIEVDLDF